MMIMLYIAVAAGVIILVAFAVMCLYALYRKTDDTVIRVEERTPLVLESETEREAVFATQFIMENRTIEDAAILDVIARPYLPQEQFPGAVVFGNMENSERRRKDNYFEAYVLKGHQKWSLILTLRFVAGGEIPIREVLREPVDMDVAIYYNGVSRKDLYIKKEFLTISAQEIKNALEDTKNA